MAQETLSLQTDDDSSISALQKKAIDETINYDTHRLQSMLSVESQKGEHDTEFDVQLETTMEALERLREETSTSGRESRICILNFASAKNPGGGFLKGSMAQEESLALSTGLYTCIEHSPMYLRNREDPLNGLYHHAIIFSPAVPVVRHADGCLLDTPYTVDILTAPAVNWGDALKKQVDEGDIRSTVAQRMDYLLHVAARHKVETLVLGSWGCGVFGGDIDYVAHTFITLLTEKYDGLFRDVCFSTLDKQHQTVFERELNNKFA